jgi:putative membrane protein
MEITTNEFVTNAKSFKANRFLHLLIAAFIVCWFAMYFNCIDVQDWFIENILVFIYALYAITTYRNFIFSNTSYLCIFLFLLLHTYGAMYAYTQNPIGEYFQNNYHLKRNPYDRVVHFSFGFLLAYPLYDILKNKLLVKRKWQYILPVNIITSLACIFELIEWTVAELTTKETGETYVATQGDVWDAHKDIVLAIVAAVIVMVVLFFTQRYKGYKEAKRLT